MVLYQKSRQVQGRKTEAFNNDNYKDKNRHNLDLFQ